AVGRLEDWLLRAHVEAPQRVAIAGLEVAPPDVPLAVEQRPGRAAPQRQVGEDRNLGRVRVVFVVLPAVHALAPAERAIPGAVAVVEGAAEVDRAVGPLVDLGMDLGPRRLAWLRRNDFVQVHDALQDLAARVPAVEEAAGVALGVVAVVTDGAIDPAISCD